MKKKYCRYKAKKLEGDARRDALKAYVEHYARIAAEAPELLNQKLPRSVSEEIHSEIGALLQQRAKELVKTSGPIRTFLRRNPVPKCLGSSLTKEVRCFSLLLHSLNQWCVVEKLAMDRFLCSGNVRKELKSLFEICPVVPGDESKTTVELHHPLRDGRPPIPLSKKGHDKVEGLVVLEVGDDDGARLIEHRKTSKPIYSWVRLRTGCLLRQGMVFADLKSSYRASARHAIKRVTEDLKSTPESILEILNRYGLGNLPQ